MGSTLRAMKRNLIEILGNDVPEEEDEFEIDRTSKRA